jgi:putative ABC transport system permease protein
VLQRTTGARLGGSTQQPFARARVIAIAVVALATFVSASRNTAGAEPSIPSIHPPSLGVGADRTSMPDLLVTDRTAHVLGLAVGDTLEIAADASMVGSRQFRIAAIERPGADPFEVGYDRLRLTLHLPDLAALVGAPDRVDRIALRLRDPSTRDEFTADLNRTAYGLHAYTSRDLAQRGSSTFVVISQFHKAIGIVSLLAGLVFLAAIMVLKVEEMRHELGVLRLLGISRRTIVRSTLAIAASIAVLGSVLGIGLGLAAIAAINPLAQARYDTDLVFARATPGVVGLAVVLSILMGLVAGLAVAVRLVHARALEQVGR